MVPVRCLRGRPATVPGRIKVWNFVLSRPLRLAAQALAITGLVAGTAAFASFDKTVDLTVDGRTSTVHTFGSTVADVLSDQGIKVGEHDIVSPSPADEVDDGDDVVVRFGRQLHVNTDGQQRDYWTTALTVDEAIAQLNLRAEGARLSVSRSQTLGRQGLNLELATPKDITLVVGGKKSTPITYALTVGDLLAERNLSLGSLDYLSAPAGTPLRDGMTVRLDRVEQLRVAKSVDVGFSTTKKKTSSLDKGETKVDRKGAEGRARVIYLVTVVNGEPIGQETLQRDVTRDPVTQVVLVGTREPAATTTSASLPSGGDGLNWAALAQCESGGNPRAVNPAGYYGLYQFSLSTWHSVGGSGNPIDASPAEQLKRAKILYARGGAGQWGCGSHLFD
ncbi:MAG TPA: ubiquitin-like domain-containing protein [Actinomycetales bacterium]|nr:ubiquitin-like domain-containing protein [Actinomycetales bacterium]